MKSFFFTKLHKTDPDENEKRCVKYEWARLDPA